jgi:hypothetical protein
MLKKAPPVDAYVDEPPQPLGPIGRSLWDAYLGDRDLPDERQRRLLFTACTAAQRAADLGSIIERDGPVIESKTGHTREHPGGETGATLPRLGEELLRASEAKRRWFTWKTRRPDSRSPRSCCATIGAGKTGSQLRSSTSMASTVWPISWSRASSKRPAFSRGHLPNTSTGFTLGSTCWLSARKPRRGGEFNRSMVRDRGSEC